MNKPMDKRWEQWAAFALGVVAAVALSACGGGEGGSDPEAAADPSAAVPVAPAASTPEQLAAALQATLDGLPPTVERLPEDPAALAEFIAAQVLPSRPANGEHTVLGPSWLAGTAHSLQFGTLRGQLAADTTAQLSVPYSTPTLELAGGADLIIGRIDGDVALKGSTAGRQFSYVVAQPSTSLPESGAITYSLAHATAVDVRVNGRSTPAPARARITAATLTANFSAGASAPLTMTLSGTLGTRAYTASLPVSSPVTLDRASASFKSDNGQGTVVDGVFAGPQGSQVGVHYTIAIDGGTLNGSLILHPAPAPAPAPAPSAAPAP
jgi:hypothetical protein